MVYTKLFSSKILNLIILIVLIWFFVPVNLIASQAEPPLTAPLPAKPGARKVTTDWLLSLPKLTFDKPMVVWLDDANLIFVLPPEDKNACQIEMVDIRTNKHKLLGEGCIATPSPNGQWIAFISEREKENNQLWIMRSNGADKKQLTRIVGGLGINGFSYNFAWSPDSKQIALSYQPLVLPWEKKQRSKTQINLIDIKNSGSKQIALLDGVISYFSWLPNSEKLLVVKEREGILYNQESDEDLIQLINTNDGHTKTLVNFDGLQQFLQPTSSPSGQQIAFMYDADNPIFTYMNSIGLVATNSNSNAPLPITRLTHEIKLDSPRWSLDGKYIYVLRDYGAYKQIYSVNVKTSELKQITNAPLNIESYALSPNGTRLAWVGQDAHGVRVVRVADSNGENARDLVTTPSVPVDMALSEVREIEWDIYRYPVKMRGLLVSPLNYHPGIRYPLIVDIHGGGAGAHIYLMGGVLVNTPLEWQLWAAKGYAVFVPEMRSSASFGSLAITRDELQEHNLIDCDIKDISTGVDMLAKQGFIDINRVAIIGHSAGGQRANWLTVSTHRYRAVVSKEGWADEWLLPLTKPPLKRIYAMFGGSPLQVPQNYLKNSALFHSWGASTPTLFLMGNPKLGGVNERKTTTLLYYALKLQGVETQFICYPDEGHVFEKDINRRDALERSIKWIDGHMNN